MLLPEGLELAQAAAKGQGALRMQPQPLQALPAKPSAQIEQPVEIRGVATEAELMPPPGKQLLACGRRGCLPIDGNSGIHPLNLGRSPAEARFGLE